MKGLRATNNVPDEIAVDVSDDNESMEGVDSSKLSSSKSLKNFSSSKSLKRASSAKSVTKSPTSKRVSSARSLPPECKTTQEGRFEEDMDFRESDSLRTSAPRGTNKKAGNVAKFLGLRTDVRHSSCRSHRPVKSSSKVNHEELQLEEDISQVDENNEKSKKLIFKGDPKESGSVYSRKSKKNVKAQGEFKDSQSVLSRKNKKELVPAEKRKKVVFEDDLKEIGSVLPRKCRRSIKTQDDFKDTGSVFSGKSRKELVPAEKRKKLPVKGDTCETGSVYSRKSKTNVEDLMDTGSVFSKMSKKSLTSKAQADTGTVYSKRSVKGVLLQDAGSVHTKKGNKGILISRKEEVSAPVETAELHSNGEGGVLGLESESKSDNEEVRLMNKRYDSFISINI